MNGTTLVFIIDVIGTVAFASSGAMVGIRKRMDLFGVIVMAITTAVGGGIIRDLILGIRPPITFQDPVYVEIAIATACVLFLLIYIRRQVLDSTVMVYYERVMSVLDAVGLGAFTVTGVHTAVDCGYRQHGFLLAFVGVITGVGGGVLRDVMAGEMPFIFVKHVYACASLAGAVICILLLPHHSLLGMGLGALAVIVIRLLAARYHWNLPKAEIERPEGEKRQ